MPDVWEMVECASCRSLYLDPRPDDESLPRAYDSYFTHTKDMETNPDKGVSGALWRLINGYLNARFEMKRQPSARLGFYLFWAAVPWRQKLDYYCRHLYAGSYPNRGSLLDLGCGNGAYLERARELGWEAVGCAPDENAVEVCRASGLEIIHGDVFNEALDGRVFDAISLSHVIEHMPEIDRALSRIYTLLRPGGTVWFALPNSKGVTVKLFSSAAFNLHFPCHLCIPSQVRFVEMLRAAGFSQVRMIRRGLQSRTIWDDSIAIADAQDLPRPGRLTLFFGRLLSDALSTVSARWGEELVFMARKDGACNPDRRV
jgi:SAM-dependent methyltransferase